MQAVSGWRLFGLAGLPVAIQHGLVVAFATSIASVMGMQLVYPAYTVPMIFLAPIAGAIADLHGRRPLLFGGLLLFGLAGAAVGLAPSFEWVLALRTLQGVGASAVMPLTIVLLSDLLQGERETSAQGLKVVLDRVSLSVIPLLAGLLAMLTWQ